MNPIVVVPLADQAATEGSVFNCVVPPGAFADPDAGDVLSYGARLSIGAALPAWLVFDAAARSFSGTPPSTAQGVIDVRVTVTDSTGATVVHLQARHRQPRDRHRCLEQQPERHIGPRPHRRATW